MKPLPPSDRIHPPERDEDERRHRDAALDETLENTFPASDPLSTDPDPDDRDADRRRHIPSAAQPGDSTR